MKVSNPQQVSLARIRKPAGLASTNQVGPQNPTKSPPLSVSGSPGGRSFPSDKSILDNLVVTKGWVQFLWMLKLLPMLGYYCKVQWSPG